jgi:asparagine synthase (glutamine-hydrolysing)
MCGIAGVWSINSSLNNDLSLMSNAIVHRGPDDNGIYIDEKANLGFVHRRLSILDLSRSGYQPMISPCGRFAIVFNGEIYNHLNLRNTLEREGGAFNWRGHSDTETLLAGLRHWGIEKCLNKLDGMFAFALWNKAEQQLYLARDRIGEKPLYYGRHGDSFLFASELKAITAHSQWQGEIDRDALSLFMKYNNVPSPYSIYKGIKKLLPAHYTVISGRGREVSDPKCYWSLAGMFDVNIDHSQSNISAEELIVELNQLLRNTVASRMQSDVPVGAFFSGGIDSTMVVAQMQAVSSKPVKTYTIGNKNSEIDEAQYANKIAKHLGTDHSTIFITAQDALSIIPKIPQIYDEPFADSSQIPTFLVSQFARRDVSVVLTGDGGDELFGGYNRHVFGPKIWAIIKHIPPVMRRMLRTQFSQISNFKTRGFKRFLPKQLQFTDFRLKLSKLFSVFDAKDDLHFYWLLRTHWHETNIVLDSSFSLQKNSLYNAKLFDQMIYQDIHTYLPDDILTKVDRASMAVSLEARAPFLSHNLIDFALKIPHRLKVRESTGKWLLREALHRYVPKELMYRSKQGFGIPIDKWLRGPLKDWAESLLNETRLSQEGYFNTNLVRAVWKDFCSGRVNREQDIWCVLMFQSWLEFQRKTSVKI